MDKKNSKDLDLINNAIFARCKDQNLWGCKIFLFGGLSLQKIISASSMPVKVIHTTRKIENSLASAKISHNNDLKIEEINKRTLDNLCNVKVPILDISFDELIENPIKAIKEISTFVGLEVNQSAIDFVNPSLRHFK